MIERLPLVNACVDDFSFVFFCFSSSLLESSSDEDSDELDSSAFLTEAGRKICKASV